MSPRASSAVVAAVMVAAMAMALASTPARASPFRLRGPAQLPPSSMPTMEQDLEAVAPVAAPDQSFAAPPPPTRSMPSLASNLPPSALSVSYYDNTEYEVSPLHMPLELPHPPPPPSFDSAAATKQANMFIETGARGYPAAPAQMMQQQQPMMMQQQQQQQGYPMQPMLFQQQQHVMGPMPPQGNAPFLPNPPPAPAMSSFLPQQPQQMMMQQPPAQQQFYAPQPMFVQQQQRMYMPAMRPPPSRRHMKLKHRMQRRPARGHRAHMIKGGTMTPRTVRRARVHQYVPQQQPAVQYGAPGPLSVSLLQTQAQLHTQTRNLAQAGTPRYYRAGETVPWITQTPASVTTRGAVPHFQAAVRSLPGQSPYANNNNDFGLQTAFVEQASTPQYATRDQYGRPVEPVMPRLPQPPAADVIVQ